MIQTRRVIGSAIVVAPLLLACGGHTEILPGNASAGDGEGAGIAGDSGSSVVDAGPSTNVEPGPKAEASTFDAQDYYCNVPEPGPCCCEPVRAEFRPPKTDAGAGGCELEIPRGRMPFVHGNINIMARLHDGKDLLLPNSKECAPGAAGWMYVSETPPVVRLCPSACEAFLSGAYDAIVVMQGCYSIACPPP